jgi:hypothetical protein
MPFDKKPLLFDPMPFSAVLPPVYASKKIFSGITSLKPLTAALFT